MTIPPASGGIGLTGCLTPIEASGSLVPVRGVVLPPRRRSHAPGVAPMPEEWSKGIIFCNLPDEPELSEDLAAVFSRIKPRADAAPEPEVPSVVLNLAEVSYLNSSHIAQLVRLRKVLGEHGKQLVLCGVNDEVWSTFLLTGLEKVFTFEPDMMTAIARVQLQEHRAEGA